MKIAVTDTYLQLKVHSIVIFKRKSRNFSWDFVFILHKQLSYTKLLKLRLGKTPYWVSFKKDRFSDFSWNMLPFQKISRNSFIHENFRFLDHCNEISHIFLESSFDYKNMHLQVLTAWTFPGCAIAHKCLGTGL